MDCLGAAVIPPEVDIPQVEPEPSQAVCPAGLPGGGGIVIGGPVDAGATGGGMAAGGMPCGGTPALPGGGGGPPPTGKGGVPGAPGAPILRHLELFILMGWTSSTVKILPFLISSTVPGMPPYGSTAGVAIVFWTVAAPPVTLADWDIVVHNAKSGYCYTCGIIRYVRACILKTRLKW